MTGYELLILKRAIESARTAVERENRAHPTRSNVITVLNNHDGRVLNAAVYPGVREMSKEDRPRLYIQLDHLLTHFLDLLEAIEENKEEGT